MKGFLPGVPSGSMDQLIGLIGSIIMPHNLFLHSGNQKLLNLTIKIYDSAILISLSFKLSKFINC